MARRRIGILLGVTAVVHGLGNAVLPLRGVDWVSPGNWSYPIILLYVLAIVGFVKVGLGLMGVRPLATDLRAMAIFAGVCSLAAQALLGDGDLWIGMVLSLALPALTVWHVTAHGARLPVRHPRLRVIGDVAGIAFFGWVAISVTVWPGTRTWGAAAHEWDMTLPGDDADRSAAHELLHGVTIDAPPSAVWPWLVQLGQDRAGFYSYDRLERLFGVNIRNAHELREEWQKLEAGDRVHATQPGYLGGLFGERPGWTVKAVEPNRALVLDRWGAFVLVPDVRGGTRLLIRSTVTNDRIPVWAAALNFTAFELPHFIMQRRMMLTIKALAEESVSAT